MNDTTDSNPVAGAPGSPVDYTTGETPTGYVCAGCGTGGVRLYRRYQAFLDKQRLSCRACACKEEKQSPNTVREHCIGWLVAAVPTEDGSTYWGFTSVPEAGVKWWEALPTINPNVGV